MTSSRDSTVDALLSGFIVLGFSAIVSGNIFCALVPDIEPFWGWMIVAGMGFGVTGSAALSARVFWRHRISLAAWMVLFGVHATAMALATQLFSWLHPAAARGAKAPGTNALLLALALISMLLVRGAVLQAAAKNMPGWMAVRKENESATPRLWLFALYWLSPLAWWGGILSVIALSRSGGSSTGAVVTLIVCLAIATIRVAVRFVLFEKNRYSNWSRSPRGWAKFREQLISGGFVLAGAVTFYAYFFMASRVQGDAVADMLRVSAEARAAELKALQPPALQPRENAETIYKLARTSAIPVNPEWLIARWDIPQGRTEIARNLTALSYFRQAAAVKGIDYGIDYEQDLTRAAFTKTVDEPARLALVEARQAAARGEWPLALENHTARLRYARHLATWPSPHTSEAAFQIESRTALTLAASLLQANAQPSDAVLAGCQRMLAEHFDARGQYANRALYVPLLAILRKSDRYRWAFLEWPGRADVRTMLSESPLGEWERQTEMESALMTLQVAMRQRMDRQDADLMAQRMTDRLQLAGYFSSSVYANLDALEALRMLETAIAVKRYQMQRGSWPSTLNDCVPQFLAEIPPDPNQRGRFIQYEASPPRVYTIGKGISAAPEDHGYPDAGYFQSFELSIKECESGNHVLFLAN